MICGHCKEPGIRSIKDLEIHWAVIACTWGGPVWERFVASKAEGHSGRRILSEAWPHLWKSDPMSEETKQALRELADRRKAAGVVMPKRRAR